MSEIDRFVNGPKMHPELPFENFLLQGRLSDAMSERDFPLSHSRLALRAINGDAANAAPATLRGHAVGLIPSAEPGACWSTLEGGGCEPSLEPEGACNVTEEGACGTLDSHCGQTFDNCPSTIADCGGGPGPSADCDPTVEPCAQAIQDCLMSEECTTTLLGCHGDGPGSAEQNRIAGAQGDAPGRHQNLI